METRVGEVIEAGTTEFTAQCYELYEVPPLGNLVRTMSGDIELFGVVYNAVTAGIEPGRKPIARGKDEENEEAIYRTNPQLLKLLKTEFRIAVVGFKQLEQIRQYLPPQPAHIHSFVYVCSLDEIKEFGRSLVFLNIMLNTKLPMATEEVIAASLRQMSSVNEDPHAYLVNAGKELAGLLGNDYARLRVILGRLQ